MDATGVVIEAVAAFADWLRVQPPLAIYAVVALVAFLENVIPPIPGDILIVIAGYFVGVGVVAFAPVCASATAGSAAGFMVLYAVGRALGDAIDDPRRLRWLPSGPVGTVRAWLARWGYAVVAVNRLLSGARAVISLLAGASRLDARRCALWATVSAALWTALLAGAGYVVGSEWERVVPFLRAYGRLVTFGLVAAGLLALGYRMRRRARAAVAAPGHGSARRGKPGGAKESAKTSASSFPHTPDG
ncbi:MAG: DedA family protein [Rubricoccaceae bacterium]